MKFATTTTPNSLTMTLKPRACPIGMRQRTPLKLAQSQRKTRTGPLHLRFVTPAHHFCGITRPLAYAVGLFIIGPLSEVFGRVIILQSANLFYLVFNTACGFAKSKQQMMAIRFLSGLGGSAPQAIGGGVLSDLWKKEERGRGLSLYNLLTFLGPSLRPLAGGYLTKYITWRWVFWCVSIADTFIQIVASLFLNETYYPAILRKKCLKLQKEIGNMELHTKRMGPDKTIPKLLQKAIVRPFIMLFTQPALQAMALYRTYGYGLMYLVLSTFPYVFEEQYDIDVGSASLSYLSLGVGFIIGLQISGPLQDRLYAYLKSHTIDPSSSLHALWHTFCHRRVNDAEQGDSEPLTPSVALPPPKRTATTTHDPSQGVPEHRVPLCLPFGLFIPIGLLIYGWSAHAHTHWIVPNIGASIFCIGLVVSPYNTQYIHLTSPSHLLLPT